MATFNLGSLGDWFVVAGVGIEFPVIPGQPRYIEFDVMAEQDVVCQALTADEFWPVATGKGLMTVKFIASETVQVVFIGAADTAVMMRTKCDSQVVPETGEATFTTIEPRGAGPSDEIRRLMYMQQINARRREALLMDEIRSMRQAAPRPPDPVVIEPDEIPQGDPDGA